MRIGYLPPDSISRFTKDGFYVVDGGEEVEIKYSDIERVTIETTDQGPWIPDCFWVIKHASGREIVVENGAPDAVALLGALQDALPGFDNGAVIKAMSSVDYASFLAWERAK
ncbi:MAG: hypothetical protein JW839_10570 [Candidatus Lokiarchaeota archaeon]|nr:hypothetical protein [Candidatus Lokiarchaeota archaeon]